CDDRGPPRRGYGSSTTRYPGPVGPGYSRTPRRGGKDTQLGYELRGRPAAGPSPPRVERRTAAEVRHDRPAEPRAAARDRVPQVPQLDQLPLPVQLLVEQCAGVVRVGDQVRLALPDHPQV